jgi:hypothetical protein
MLGPNSSLTKLMRMQQFGRNAQRCRHYLISQTVRNTTTPKAPTDRGKRWYAIFDEPLADELDRATAAAIGREFAHSLPHAGLPKDRSWRPRCRITYTPTPDPDYYEFLLWLSGLWCAQSCGIRGKAATDSEGKRPVIPTEGGHPFRSKAATQSDRRRPPF